MNKDMKTSNTLFPNTAQPDSNGVYQVTIARTGVVFVRAASESAAMELADRLKTDEVSWSDDWNPTDAMRVEDYGGIPYTEPSF